MVRRMKNAISVEHLSKQYDLGVIGTGTISRDLERWWARVRRKPDPYSRIGQGVVFELIVETFLAMPGQFVCLYSDCVIDRCCVLQPDGKDLY